MAETNCRCILEGNCVSSVLGPGKAKPTEEEVTAAKREVRKTCSSCVLGGGKRNVVH